MSERTCRSQSTFSAQRELAQHLCCHAVTRVQVKVALVCPRRVEAQAWHCEAMRDERQLASAGGAVNRKLVEQICMDNKAVG